MRYDKVNEEKGFEIWDMLYYNNLLCVKWLVLYRFIEIVYISFRKN